MESNYLFSITFSLSSEQEFYITCYSGVFAAKLFYDLLNQAGIAFSKETVKPFSITPLESLRQGVIISEKWVKIHPNEVLSFTVNTNDYTLIRRLLNTMERVKSLNEPCGTIHFTGATLKMSVIQKIDLESWTKKGDWKNYKLKIDFMTPTRFRMRGHEVVYPSHVRFMRAVARTFYEVAGVDARKIVNPLILSNMELEKSITRKIVIDIGKERGYTRKVSGFIGKAEYILHIKEQIYDQVKALLSVAEVMGVGANKSLGFGRIRVLEFDESDA